MPSFYGLTDEEKRVLNTLEQVEGFVYDDIIYESNGDHVFEAASKTIEHLIELGHLEYDGEVWVLSGSA